MWPLILKNSSCLNLEIFYAIISQNEQGWCKHNFNAYDSLPYFDIVEKT